MLTIRWFSAVALLFFFLTGCMLPTSSAQAASVFAQSGVWVNLSGKLTAARPVAQIATQPAPQSEAQSTAQCLRLPDTPRSRGDISQNDIQHWLGLKDWEFFTNSDYLSTGFMADGTAYFRQQLRPTEKGSVRVVGRGKLGAARTYSLSQSLYLEEGFDWGAKNEGGKLGFGLGGNTSPTGGDMRHDGFSARLMWRGNGDGSARLVVYAYSADRGQNLPYGDDHILQDFQVPLGQWFTVTIEVTINSATASADGRLRVWINDNLKLQRKGIQWQSEGPEPVVDRLLYATFHGGNDASWSPSEAVYARIANVCWQPHEYNASGLTR